MKISPIYFQNPQKGKNISYTYNSENKNRNVKSHLTQNNEFVLLNQYLPQINFTGSETYNKVIQYFDKKIVGFSKEKDNLAKHFTEPFIESFKNTSIYIPNGVMLFGPENRLVECFANTTREIAYQTAGNKIFDLSNETNENFILKVRDILEQAKNYYNETGKRSIIYLNNIENFLGMTYNQAKKLVDFNYSIKEIEFLKNSNNINNIEYFKSLLDNCASPPNSGGYGSTFLFISNFPHLIHPDFRKGKIDKFEIPRPQDNENANILIENITRCKDSLMNIKDYPDCLARKLNILEDLNKKNFTDNDYNEINKICKTDEQLGAFSYDDLYKIALKTSLKSINPKNSLSGKEVLYYELINTPRSYTPKMIIRQNKISNLVNNRQSTFQILCGKEELGIITNKEQLLLDELKIKRKNDLISLTEKEKTSNLNDFEKDYLEELRTYEE